MKKIANLNQNEYALYNTYTEWSSLIYSIKS